MNEVYLKILKHLPDATKDESFTQEQKQEMFDYIKYNFTKEELLNFKKSGFYNPTIFSCLGISCSKCPFGNLYLKNKGE